MTIKFAAGRAPEIGLEQCMQHQRRGLKVPSDRNDETAAPRPAKSMQRSAYIGQARQKTGMKPARHILLDSCAVAMS